MKKTLRAAFFLTVVFLSSCSSSTPPNLAVHSASNATPLLLVTPAPALINEKTSQAYAQDVAAALNDYGFLTTDNHANNKSWQLQISTTSQNNLITLHYEIIGPDKKKYAHMVGTSIPYHDWKTAQQAKLSESAAKDSANLSKIFTAINSIVQKNNPHSLANRTPILFIGQAVGAPGKADKIFPVQLAKTLKTAPVELTSTPENADFSVTCLVEITSTAPGEKLAEINWLVKDSGNRLVGQVTQLHELNPLTPLEFWNTPPASEIQEAAEGILTVIHNDILKTKEKSAT